MDAVDIFTAQWAAEKPGVDVYALEAWGRLKRTANLFEKALSQVLDECDLNMAEFEVLAALVRMGPPYEMRPTELTRSLIITPGAVTARLTTLERRGFIARRPHVEDRRVQLVALSAMGLRAFEPALGQIILRCESILDELNLEEHDNLLSSLRGLMKVLDGENISAAVEDVAVDSTVA
ncbi:MAG: Transcriptional regulator [Rhodoglobus sp.]|nr:Transcriptional regulator [Rhodoglobus sp.]